MDNQPKPQGGTPEHGVGPELTVPAVAPGELAPAAPSSPTTAPVAVPVPAVNSGTTPAADTSAVMPVSGGVQKPVIADDVDVIEKEWVDAAEDIVAATSQDPRKEEEQVEELQIDYLKKRYGKDVKRS